jgi:tyrosinase
MSRVRHSIQYIQQKYDSGEDRSLLEGLVRAFRGIQKLKPDNPDSFWMIAGYHGEPFRGPGATDPKWWGGYCNHGNILFPTWHRAYLHRLENALRKVPKCQDVTLPYWDELLDHEHPIPSIFLSPTFNLDEDDCNPLYSYKLQLDLDEKVTGANNRYTKAAGYETVRFPLSGLVGTEEDRKNTKVWNSGFTDAESRNKLLNNNVRQWLDGTIKLEADPGGRIPDTYSVRSRYQRCLRAPNYTVFSNTVAQAKWIEDHKLEPDVVVSLESPHNAIHLAVGGFYQEGVYNANVKPLLYANGDMGDNETAGFDPIFFFHHAFIDYAFWTWQKWHGRTKPGSLDVITGYPGTYLEEGQAGEPDMPPNTKLTMDTPLYPFKNAAGDYVTSNDVTNIEEQLGYAYGPGSLDPVLRTPAGPKPTEPLATIKRVSGINRADYAGSFVIRLLAVDANGKKIEIGREPVLSRWSVTGCKNCQTSLNVKSHVPIHESLMRALTGPAGDPAGIQYECVIQTHNLPGEPQVPHDGLRTAPQAVIDDL